jgi:hypothetical protein
MTVFASEVLEVCPERKLVGVPTLLELPGGEYLLFFFFFR